MSTPSIYLPNDSGSLTEYTPALRQAVRAALVDYMAHASERDQEALTRALAHFSRITDPFNYYQVAEAA